MSDSSEKEEVLEPETQEIKEKPQAKPKVKRERTEKQKEHFARLSELNKKRYEEKKLIKEEEEAKRRRELEKKVIEKAIKIKKKIIKKEMLLEELSDDDTPIEKKKNVAPKRVERPDKSLGFVESPKYVSKFNYVR